MSPLTPVRKRKFKGFLNLKSGHLFHVEVQRAASAGLTGPERFTFMTVFRSFLEAKMNEHIIMCM